MVLERAEREKFVQFLEQEAQSAIGIANQLQQNVPGVGVELARRERQYAVACNIVAGRLRETHKMTIGG